MAKRTKKTGDKNGNGATLRFEQTRGGAADKMRSHMDAAVYKHIVLVTLRNALLPKLLSGEVSTGTFGEQ